MRDIPLPLAFIAVLALFTVGMVVTRQPGPAVVFDAVHVTADPLDFCVCLDTDACGRDSDDSHPLGSWCYVAEAPCLDFRGVTHRTDTWSYCENVVGGTDECADNKCLNGGICVDGNGDYTCDCPSGWRGDRCEGKAHVEYVLQLDVEEEGCLRYDPRDPSFCADTVGVDMPKMNKMRFRFIGDGGESGLLALSEKNLEVLGPGASEQIRLIGPDVGLLQSVVVKCYPTDAVKLDFLSVSKTGTLHKTPKVTIDGLGTAPIPLGDTEQPAAVAPAAAVADTAAELVTSTSSSSPSPAPVQGLSANAAIAVWSDDAAIFDPSALNTAWGAAEGSPIAQIQLSSALATGGELTFTPAKDGFAFVLLDPSSTGGYDDILPADSAQHWTRRSDLTIAVGTEAAFKARDGGGSGDGLTTLMAFQTQTAAGTAVVLPGIASAATLSATVIVVEAPATADPYICALFDEGAAWSGTIENTLATNDADTCQAACTAADAAECTFFTFKEDDSSADGTCVLLTSFAERRLEEGTTSGYPCTRT